MWWPLLAPTGLMVCVCVCVALLMALLALSDGFFFFFSFCCDAGFFFFFFFNMGFCSAGILVSSGQWWLGFFWVFVPMGLCVALCVELVLKVEGEREEKKNCWKA